MYVTRIVATARVEDPKTSFSQRDQTTSSARLPAPERNRRPASASVRASPAAPLLIVVDMPGLYVTRAGRPAGAVLPRARLPPMRASDTQHAAEWTGHALLLLTAALAAGVRWRMVAAPLERDEGEFAYVAQLMLRGIPPYVETANMKLPGTYAAVAGAMAVFGETATGVRLGLLVANLLSAACVYLLARRLVDPPRAPLAAVAFLLTSLTSGVLGLAAHATQFVLPPALAGLLLVLRGAERRSPAALAGGGALLGVAILMKQPGAIFLVLGLLLAAGLAARAGRGARGAVADAALVLAASLVPLAFTGAVLWWAGAFAEFWRWTVSYAGAYVGAMPLSKVPGFLPARVQAVAAGAGWFWWLGLLGPLAGLAIAGSRRTSLVLLGGGVLSFAGVSAGLYYRPHYFVLLLPALSLGAALAVAVATRLLTGRVPGLVAWFLPTGALLACALATLWSERVSWFQAPPATYVFERYRGNPFVESVPVGDFLRARAAPADRLAVLGSEPQILFYAGLLPATRVLYTYPFFEPTPFAPILERRMIEEIETSRPRWIVLAKPRISWQLWPRQDVTIYDWTTRYVGRHYDPVARAERGANQLITDPVRVRLDVPETVLIVLERRP